MTQPDPTKFLHTVLIPGLQKLYQLTGVKSNTDAIVLMLTIAFQETGRLSSRYQLTGSNNVIPARGWWQFEKAGGVRGVRTHDSTSKKLAVMLDEYWVRGTDDAIWRAIEGHDGLAVALARLLLYSDPRPIPDGSFAAWGYYLRNWRPGKPHHATWDGYYAEAKRLVGTLSIEQDLIPQPIDPQPDVVSVHREASLRLVEASVKLTEAAANLQAAIDRFEEITG